MECIIIFTRNELFANLSEKLYQSNDHELFVGDNLEILFKGSKLLIVEKISLADTISPPLAEVKEHDLNAYALYYSNISLLKQVLNMVDCHLTWINNDFDGINYKCIDFIKKINTDTNWDWRLP